MKCLNCEELTKNPKFCNRSCSNSYHNKLRTLSSETKSKISKGVKNSVYFKKLKTRKKNYIIIYCKFCLKQIKTERRDQKFCSISCSNKNRIKRDDKYIQYSLKCQFNFNVYNYPNKFNLKLIKEYGWYKASNRGNNLNGISRDHMFSIYDGFKNNISPEIIKHPGNCKLMVHKENNSKHTTSSISLITLKQRIDNW